MLAYKQIAPLLVLPAALAADRDGWTYTSIFSSGLPSVKDNYTRQLIYDAFQHPNATRSIDFKPLVGIPEEIDIGNLRDASWTWRVNVSDFAAPNAKPEFVDEEPGFVDPHVVTTSYDFTFPSSFALNSSSVSNTTIYPFCIGHWSVFATPVNVSNTYTDKNTGSTDCAPALGSECVEAILKESRQETKSSCSSYAWWDLPECIDTIGYATSYKKGEGGTIIGTELSSDYPSGESFYSATTAASNGTNTTPYEDAANALQVMMVNPRVDNLWRPQLLCMRVNTTQLQVPGNTTQPEQGPGGTTNGTTQSDDEEGAAFSARYGSATSLAFALSWTLLASIYAIL